MTCLLGILLFDRKVFRRFQLGFWDLSMLVWCAVPLLAALANSQALSVAICNELYQILSWGVPYLMGRLYFADVESWKLAAKAFVIAGMAYVPICLIEMYTGPQFYARVYGYQPYRWIGAQRYIGFRPIGFLEDGNQLGIWMAISALIAIWLWRLHIVDRLLGISISWVSGTLFGVTLLCQSAGSIVLLLCLLPFVWFRKSNLPRAFIGLFVLVVFGFMALRLANVVSLQTLVKQNAFARSTANSLRRIRRGSFGWRLSQDEKYVGLALEQPLLGYGEWDWWKGGSTRPWGLWLLTFGMYGLLGLAALECIQLVPVARILWPPDANSDPSTLDLRKALAGAILMSAIDNLLNGSMILPLLLAVGGLSAPVMVASTDRVRAGMRRPVQAAGISKRL
jgi:hypothetical protein